MSAQTIREIFDREIAEMEDNQEPSPMIDWLGRLRDEVLAVVVDHEPPSRHHSGGM